MDPLGWEVWNPQTTYTRRKKIKIMPITRYRREYEHVDLMLITIVYDTTTTYTTTWCGVTKNKDGKRGICGENINVPHMKIKPMNLFCTTTCTIGTHVLWCKWYDNRPRKVVQISAQLGVQNLSLHQKGYLVFDTQYTNAYTKCQ